MQKLSQSLRRQGKLIGLVPTMGYLHQGHLSLVRLARKKSAVVVASIFVNPLQFGPKEDFQKYPRDINRDKKLLAQEKCDVLFSPSAREMYPDDFLTSVSVSKMSDRLEGASRPGHFNGVVTVLAKLFNIILPDLAFFGQKDAQQVVVVKKMVEDLNFPAKIVVAPTVRDKSGLALSSRNSYLKAQEYQPALSLSRALREAKKMIIQGEKDPEKVMAEMRKIIEEQPLTRIDYLAITDTKELLPVDKIKGQILISLAVRVGGTRLIDNLCLKVNNRVKESRC